jgi:hypothetical protein
MLSQDEFEAILSDPTKQIEGDILWREDDDHSPTVEFRAEIISEPGYPLVVKGSYNPLAPALSYVIIHRNVGRIYALDLGKDHRNPTGERVGEKHKHRWREDCRDKWAYVPPDVTALVTEPLEVWQQFCIESNIIHTGKLNRPPPYQPDLFF